MNYKQLTDEQREQMTNERLLQLEAQHFQHTLNIEAIQLSSDSDEQKAAAIEQEQKSIATIENAHAAVVAASDKLKNGKGKSEK